MTESLLDVAPAPYKSTILIVDDVPDNLSLLASLLKDTYNIKVANNGHTALEYLKGCSNKPDIILLDILMPGLSGYDVMDALKEDLTTQHIPVIFLTSMDEERDERYGLELGAVDYIAKPISAPIMLAHIKAHLENRAITNSLGNLEVAIAKCKHESFALEDAIILTLATLADSRCLPTVNHIQRIQHYIRVLADKLQNHPRFSHFLSEQTIKHLFRAASLHDIGNASISDAVLVQQSPLNTQELEIIQSHTTLGREAIERVEKMLGVEEEFLCIAKEIIYYHHAKWDGTGYPIGIAGDAIPIPARLMAVADAYETLNCNQISSDTISHKQIIENIVAGTGTDFDPDVVDACIASQAEFSAIEIRFPY